jgi:hypothetical protein
VRTPADKVERYLIRWPPDCSDDVRARLIGGEGEPDVDENENDRGAKCADDAHERATHATPATAIHGGGQIAEETVQTQDDDQRVAAGTHHAWHWMENRHGEALIL